MVYDCLLEGNVGVEAAKKRVKIAVFCVDNNDTSCEVDDIIRHVSSRRIDVISLLQNETSSSAYAEFNVDDRKAFTLCIQEG